jgi:hypothetical protein
MSDYGDFCREHRKARQEKRRKNWSRNIDELQRIAKRDRNFSLYTVGEEYRVSLEYPGGTLSAKFWPSTGSTIFMFGRDSKTKTFNPSQLYKALKDAAAKNETNKQGKRRAPRSTDVRPVLNSPPALADAMEIAAVILGDDAGDAATLALASEIVERAIDDR